MANGLQSSLDYSAALINDNVYILGGSGGINIIVQMKEVAQRSYLYIDELSSWCSLCSEHLVILIMASTQPCSRISHIEMEAGN